jgi:hypothetical protein
MCLTLCEALYTSQKKNIINFKDLLIIIFIIKIKIKVKSKYYNILLKSLLYLKIPALFLLIFKSLKLKYIIK